MCLLLCIWVFPKKGVPQNGWFTMESPIKVDDLGVPLFLETPIYCCILVVVIGEPNKTGEEKPSQVCG